MTEYIIQANRGGTQLPTFFLDGNVQGITDAVMAARVALDVLTPHASTLSFLRETLTGDLEAMVTSVYEMGEHSYATGDVTYYIHAAIAEDVTTPADRDARIAGV